MIVKLQRPLSPTPEGEQELAMVYNESRTYQAMIPFEEVANLFKNNELRVYHKAKLSHTKGIEAVEHGDSVSLNLQTGRAGHIAASRDRLVVGRRMENQEW